MSVQFANDLLLSEGELFPLGQIRECLRQMEQHHLGVFRRSTNLVDDVFAWSFMPAEALQMLRSGVCVAVQSAPYSGVGENAKDIDAIDPVPVHTVRLRPNCIVHMELPDDLSSSDVRKLHHMLKVLAIDAPETCAGWPFPRGRPATVNEDDAMDDADEFTDSDLGADVDADDEDAEGPTI